MASKSVMDNTHMYMQMNARRNHDRLQPPAEGLSGIKGRIGGRTVTAPTQHDSGAVADEARGTGYQHRHGWRPLGLSAALARLRRLRLVEGHVCALQSKERCLTFLA